MTDVTKPAEGDGETGAFAVAHDVPPLAVVVRLEQDGNVKKSQRLPMGEMSVGAASGCDLIISDPAVSRRHLRLRVVPAGIEVEDLGSRNGTFFGAHRIGRLTLGLGSRIRLGESQLLFEADRDDFEGTQGESLESYGELVGRAPSMQRLFTLMRRLEGSLAGVLIFGETGTGKELVARALHEESRVKTGPLISINCGALDRSLVRSELFGHKKGAFTGALADAVGALEAADGGTLFLDEIGDLPLEVQPVLLRALESGEFCRVGETRTRRTSARVIAATNRDLEQDVADGLFREDLYFRLRVVCLTVPPLSARPEDIPLLVQRLSERLGMGALPADIQQELATRRFRGNVRELRHLIEAYGALGELPEGRKAETSQLSMALEGLIDETLPYAEQKERVVEEMTRVYLRKVVERTSGNRSEAARIAQLQRGYLRRLLEKYELA